MPCLLQDACQTRETRDPSAVDFANMLIGGVLPWYERTSICLAPWLNS